MKLDIDLNYNGNCEQAFRFYEQHLGGKIWGDFAALPLTAAVLADLTPRLGSRPRTT